MYDTEADLGAQPHNTFTGGTQEKKPGWKLSSLALLLASALGISLFAMSGLSSLVVGLLAVLNGGVQDLSALPYISTAWTSLLFTALMVPPAVLAIFSLRGRQLQLNLARYSRLPAVLMLCLPILLVIGAAAIKLPPLALLVVPPVQLLVLCIAFLFFFSLGVYGLRSPSTLRAWGTAAFGLLVTPAITVLLELVVLVVVLLLFILWLTGQPELLAQFTSLTEQLAVTGPDMDALETLVSPLVASPAVAFTILALAAGIVPLIEELIKPLAVWALAVKGITQAEGFIYGMISGLCFAVFESGTLLASAASADSWMMLVLARCGTGLLHMTTAGLTGAAIAGIRRPGGWIKVILATLLAAGIHSLWNLFGAASGLLALKPENSLLTALGTAAPYAIGFLMVGMTVLLVLVNRRLRRQALAGGSQEFTEEVK